MSSRRIDIAIHDLAKGFRTFNRNVRSAVSIGLRVFTRELKMRAPVDKGDYQRSWNNEGAITVGNTTIGAISNDRIYGPHLEVGGVPGQSPWPNPGPKTVRRNSRIWSTQAIGGTLKHVINEKNATILAKNVADSVMKGFE